MGATEGEPSAKRARLDKARASFLRQDLMDEETRACLRKQIANSEPYTHGAIENLGDVEFMTKVRDEIVNNLQATYKETDLFKVFQTGDLLNMDALEPDQVAKLQHLLALRDAVYSKEFRAFISDITGAGELSDQTDMSCNVHPRTGHLLTHDDVIGTRRVSFIIYLTEPDEPWTEQDGGALELYPLVDGNRHCPATEPTKCLLPTFNTMAFFVVQPGKSFHAVQEVFAEDKPRLSVQGWYHAPHAPEDAEQASLQQLQMVAGEDCAKEHLPFTGQGDPMGDLTDEDTALLLKWVNPVYLGEDSWAAIQGKFQKDGSIQLQNFLRKSVADAISKAAAAEDERDKLGGGQVPTYTAGFGGGWAAVGPPHKQRYLRYEEPAAAAAAAAGGSCGQLLECVRRELFSSVAFARLLKKFITVGMLGHQGQVRRFRPGLDYTVAHYGVLTKDPRLDVVLCFVDDSDQERREAWDSGDIGGFEAYLLADEDEKEKGPAEVYRSNDDDGGVINVSAASNSLNLLMRDEGLMKFVRYVSFLAPSSRWDVAMEYKPEDDSDEDEDEEQE